MNIFTSIVYLFRENIRLNIISKVSLRLLEVLHYNFDIRMWLGKILNHILHFFSHTILSFILPSISTNSSSLLLRYTPICPLIHSHGQCKWGSLEHFSGQNKFFLHWRAAEIIWHVIYELLYLYFYFIFFLQRSFQLNIEEQNYFIF